MSFYLRRGGATTSRQRPHKKRPRTPRVAGQATRLAKNSLTYLVHEETLLIDYE